MGGGELPGRVDETLLALPMEEEIKKLERLRARRPAEIRVPLRAEEGDGGQRIGGSGGGAPQAAEAAEGQLRLQTLKVS